MAHENEKQFSNFRLPLLARHFHHFPDKLRLYLFSGQIATESKKSSAPEKILECRKHDSAELDWVSESGESGKSGKWGKQGREVQISERTSFEFRPSKNGTLSGNSSHNDVHNYRETIELFARESAPIEKNVGDPIDNFLALLRRRSSTILPADNNWKFLIRFDFYWFCRWIEISATASPPLALIDCQLKCLAMAFGRRKTTLTRWWCHAVMRRHEGTEFCSMIWRHE